MIPIIGELFPLTYWQNSGREMERGAERIDVISMHGCHKKGQKEKMPWLSKEGLERE